MHVYFVDILIPQFLKDGLVNTILLKLGHLYVHFVTFGDRVRDDCWHIWVGEGSWCLSHYGWLTAIAVVFPNVPFHILHCPGKLVRGFWTKVKDVTLQVTAPALEVCMGFRLWTLGFGSILLTSVLLELVCLPLVFFSQVLRLVSFRWTGWFRFNHSLHFYPIFLTVILNSKIVCRKFYGLRKTVYPYKISS